MKKILTIILIFIIFLSFKLWAKGETEWNTYRGNNLRWGYGESNFSPPLMEGAYYIGNATFTSPIYADGKIFVGSGDKNLYCFDEETLKPLWTYETDGAIIGAPAYDDGKIYFGTVDGYFFCLDITNPQKYLWRYNTYSKIYTSPLVLGNIVYFGVETGLVYALNKFNGKEVWNSPFTTNGKINSSIAGDDTSIFFISQDGYLYAVHPLTGELLWKRTVGPNVKATPVIKGNYVYILNFQGQLLAINRLTRNQDWYYSLNQDTTTTPAISGDLAIVVGNNGRVACVDLKTGKARWEKSLGGKFDTSPVVTDRYIFIGDNSSTLYMLSIENGTTLWFTKYEKGFYNDFCIQNNKLYTPMLDNSLRYFISQPPPFLTVEPLTLDFGEVDVNSKKTLSFIIKNKGGGTLTGKISAENFYWIKVFPTEFSANEVIVNVTVDTTGFSMETEYKGKIIIKSNGGDAEVSVILKTKSLPPKLSVTPKLIDYGNINKGDKKVIQIQIKNLGGGKLFGTLSTDVNWIQFETINFEGNDIKVNVTLNAENLIVGQRYKGLIYVESNGGKETIEIYINVVEPNPILFVDTNTLNFGEVKKGDSPSKIFVISNKGGGTLSGTISTLDDFIILSTKTFSGNEVRVTVTLKTDNLIEDKLYVGKIEINTQWGKATIEVYVKILKREETVQKVVIILQIGNKVIYVNNQPQIIDVPPQIIEGRTLLPIRYVVEPLGAKIFWDDVEKRVTIEFKDITIDLWIGKALAKVNGKETPIDPNNPKVVPMIIKGRTMLPVRFVAENLGCKVDWDGATKTITITYPKD
ncbi:MAG: PQQ-binding-like beta-propeller repeat protein [Caldisericia bacterium]|jgi:outer membrane protein assembly factor BamB|nr:PQQ-binding-like beta-propeller repeat protein [Caldisericia bacterium]